jgi:hypothetical protein
MECAGSPIFARPPGATQQGNRRGADFARERPVAGAENAAF